jgi:hypothetical protein
MGVQKPCSWVIGAESNDGVTSCIDENDVPAHWIGGEGGKIRGVKVTYSLVAAVQNLKNVAVEMDYVNSD